MIKEQFRDAIIGKINEVYDTQKDSIESAAQIIAEAAMKGAGIHVYDSGHIVDSELISRAGGLAMLRRLKYTLTIDNTARTAGEQVPASLEGIGKMVLTGSKAKPGDVLIMGSVSGKSFNLIDIALAALDMGLRLIVITSLEYSSLLKSEHPSGKKLYELGEVVIGNCAPKCDAMIEVEGIENKFGPASGISAAFAMWCVSAEVIEIMMSKGVEPSIFRSINFPGGWDNYYSLCDRYEELGY